MSKGYNKNGLYIDTGLLRDHVSKLREEKKLANRLYEHVAVMKSVADPTVAHQYNSILRDIEQMIEYFDRMAKQLAHMEEEAALMSRELKGVIQDSTELTDRTVSERFLL